jgi:ArsR family transcriptional regulator
MAKEADVNKKWEEQAKTLSLMAHPVRLFILEQLVDGPRCVSDVKEMIPISQPNFSQHLAALRKARLVASHSSGPLRCYYLLQPELITDLMEILGRKARIKILNKDTVVSEVCKQKREQMAALQEV